LKIDLRLLVKIFWDNIYMERIEINNTVTAKKVAGMIEMRG
jgi:hypothetical protein